MQLKPKNQQVVLVVEASNGIVRETALEFNNRGAFVVCARSQYNKASL